MSDLFNFLTDDWKKIPANFRFLLLIGAFLIFNTWLLDHWGTIEPYRLWYIDIRSIGYSLGLTIIFFGCLLLITKQLWFFSNIVYLRWKYPLSKLNKDFFLISFRGYIVLFDKKKNLYHHIYPFATVQDLTFVDCWSYVSNDFPPDTELLIPVGNKNLYHKFKLFDDGGPINTRV